jgi:alanine racemase
MLRSEAVIDLAAISRNTRLLRQKTATTVMAVVKADGYGHGMIPAAHAAVAGGAGWLGVALLEEALQLRAAGFSTPILAWLWSPQDVVALRSAVLADVDVSVSSRSALELLAGVAGDVHRVARIHLKADTGLSRNGAVEADWPDLVRSAAKYAEQGQVEIVGIWSHLVSSEVPDAPITELQVNRFEEALERAHRLGVEPQIRHLANSAGALMLPRARYDLIRPGISLYGLSPAPDVSDFGLRPAMTLRSRLANVKRIPAGSGISYNHRYEVATDTTVALVPLGYADGVPRAAANRGPVSIGGHRYSVSGTVAMDQFVVDVGDADITEGDEVILFGPGDHGEPTAQDWAQALDTIHYEVVARIGSRVPRSYLGDEGDGISARSDVTR